MAAAHGVHYAETFTGFKWIARTVLEHPDQRFVFGYEQALGYLVAAAPLDKDGITAAVLMAEVAALAAAEGVTLQDRLDDIADRFGRHVIAERSVRMEPADGRGRVSRAAGRPADRGRPARRSPSVDWFAEAGLLRFQLEGGVRVQVRPSGTEPKVKLYGEAIDADPTPFSTPWSPTSRAVFNPDHLGRVSARGPRLPWHGRDRSHPDDPPPDLRWRSDRDGRRRNPRRRTRQPRSGTPRVPRSTVRR